MVKHGKLKGTLKKGDTFLSRIDELPDKSRVEFVRYDEESYNTKVLTDPSSLESLKGIDGVKWISFTGNLEQSWIDSLETHLDLHPLVVEDILNPEQRPKVEEFEEYLFITLKMFFSSHKKMIAQQLNIVLGKGYVLTFQRHPNNVFDDTIKRIKSGKGRIRTMGSDYLVYRLIDAVIDTYFNVIEKVGEMVEDIEDRLVKNPDESILYDVHSLKRDMIYLRRSIWPMRDVVGSLSRDRSSMINTETEIFFRDIYDHTIQVIDMIETFRDMLSGMLDLYLSSLSNRMNEVMKVLTIIATIFIPLTFVAGIYGMNFDPDASPLNMPELNWFYGYPITLFGMLLISLMMLLYFRRKKWI